MMPMTRRALYLQDAHPIRDAIAYTQYAEEKGFEAVWQADSRLVREAGVLMAAFGATTDTIKIGSGVIDGLRIRRPVAHLHRGLRDARAIDALREQNRARSKS